MIVNQPLMGAADFEDYANEQSKFEADVGLLDTFSAGVEEGWYAGPTSSIFNFLKSRGGEKDLTGAEANKRYMLEGTTAAFDDNEMVSDQHARVVTDRLINRQANETMAEEVYRNHGGIGTAVNFGGNIFGGVIDPINLAAGVGTSMAATRFGAFSAANIADDIVRNRGIGDIFARNFAENLVVTTAIEYSATPLGEVAFNQEITDEQKMMTIIGGTMFGGVLGGVVESSLYRAARNASYSSLRSYGSKAEPVITESQKKYNADIAAEVKPNPDHIVKMFEYDAYGTRPDQAEYIFTKNMSGRSVMLSPAEKFTASQAAELPNLQSKLNKLESSTKRIKDKKKLSAKRSEIAALKKQIKEATEKQQVLSKDVMDMSPAQLEKYSDELSLRSRETGKDSNIFEKSSSVHEQEWVIGRGFADDTFDQVEVHGNGTITVVDNYNLAHNRVSAFKETEQVGEIFKVKLNKNMKILDSDEFIMNRPSISKVIGDNIKDTARLSASNRRKVDAALAKSARESRTIGEFKTMIMDELGDIKNLPSVDDLVNTSLSRLGYDGYHFTGGAGTVQAKYNGLTLFRQEAFKGSKKNSMYVGKGAGDITSSAASAKNGNRLFYNKDMFDVYDGELTRPMDPLDSRTQDYIKPMQDMEAGELRRRNDNKQSLYYDEKAAKLLANSKEVGDDWDPALDFLDREAIEVAQLKKVKDLDAETKAALNRIETNNYIKDAYLEYAKCRGF